MKHGGTLAQAGDAARQHKVSRRLLFFFYRPPPPGRMSAVIAFQGDGSGLSHCLQKGEGEGEAIRMDEPWPSHLQRHPGMQCSR